MNLGLPDGVGELLGAGQPAFEPGGQLGLQLVFGDADGVGFGFQGELDFDVVLFRAEDDADGGLVIRGAFLVVQEVQIEIHFAGVFRLEGADFEIERDERLEEAMVEEQVGVRCSMFNVQCFSASFASFA